MANKREQRRGAGSNFGAGLDHIPTTPLSEIDQQLFGALSDLGNISSAITTSTNGEIQIGNFTLTSRGLIVQDGFTHAEWDDIGVLLRRLEGSLQFLIGDWCNMGEDNWGEKYDQIAERTGYNPKSLREYAYVARSVDLSIRMDKLTFGHHQLVAPFPADLQNQWLEYAAANNLSVAKMRQAIKEQAGIDLPKRDSFASFSSQWLRQASSLDYYELSARLEQLRELVKQGEEILRSKQ